MATMSGSSAFVRRTTSSTNARPMVAPTCMSDSCTMVVPSLAAGQPGQANVHLGHRQLAQRLPDRHRPDHPGAQPGEPAQRPGQQGPSRRVQRLADAHLGSQHRRQPHQVGGHQQREQQEHQPHPDEGGPGHQARPLQRHAPDDQKWQRQAGRQHDQRAAGPWPVRKWQLGVTNQPHPEVEMNTADDAEDDGEEDQDPWHAPKSWPSPDAVKCRGSGGFPIV